MNEFASPEFLSDFFEEADELLQNGVSQLLALEATPGVRDDERLHELFRVVHSLKGLCGMVGLTSGADVSHALESLLADVRHAQRALSASEIDSLFDGARVLTACVETLRSPDAPQPDVADFISRLVPVAPRAADSPSADPVVEDVPAVLRGVIPDTSWPNLRSTPRGADERLWLVTFTPSRERQERGLDVNSVRQRLGEGGRLLESRPLMREGQVSFAFVVASLGPAAPDDDLQWVEIDAPAAPQRPVAVSSSGTIRVELDTVDDLLRMVGDLVMSRSRLQDEVERLDRGSGLPLLDVCGQMERSLKRLREAVMRVRLVPLSDLFSRMPLAVRDLARLSQRRIKLNLVGQETLADKAIVDRLLDPLMHLVRNAVIHGLEPSDDRVSRRKPPEGHVTLRARNQGDGILIEVEDDGRGLNVAAIAQRARELGIYPQDAPDADVPLLDVLCRPGFSTRSKADMAAGRGVGLDVVKQAVQACGGTIAVDSRPGQGTTFTLRLPQTLTIIDAFIVHAGGRRYAVPRSSVEAVLRLEQSEVRQVANGELMSYRETPLPLVRLAGVLGVSNGSPPATQHALLVNNGGSWVGLVVDEINGLRDVVVRVVTDPLIRRPGVGGVTDTIGRGATLILDVNGVLALARRRPLKGGLT